MAYLNFDNIDVLVNNSGILSTNASLSSNNAINPAYFVGGVRPINQLPNSNVRLNFRTSYIPQVSCEPNFSVLSKIINMTIDTGYYGEKIHFAGLYGNNFFLDNYNLKIGLNNVAEASASYTAFWDLCGNLNTKGNTYEYNQYGDVIHSWSTHINNTGDSIRQPVYDISYDVSITWQPILALGYKTPVDIKLMNISETLSFSVDQYLPTTFSGENATNILQTNDNDIIYKDISILCENSCDNSNSITLNISGFKIKTAEIQSQNNELVRVSYLATRFQ